MTTLTLPTQPVALGTPGYLTGTGSGDTIALFDPLAPGDTNADAPPSGSSSTVGVNAEATWSDPHSTQPVSGDLTLTAAAGRNAPSSSTFAGVMGNVFGDALTKTGTYIAGVIGKFSVTGARATHFVAAALAGIIADGTDTAQAAVVAVLDGDGAAAKADAAFGVDCLNSNAGSSFGFGLDLQKAAHDGFLAVAYTKAPVRLGSDVVFLVGAGSPTSGASGTGDDVAGKGSIYVDVTNGNLYVQAGAITAPDWKLVTRAA